MTVRNESQFGTADFYSSSLRQLGHEAWDVHFNNTFLQAAWAREHGLPDAPRWRVRWRRGIVPWPVRSDETWLSEILHAQIGAMRPDVLLTTDMIRFDDDEIRRW